jgi:hypothetical protein
MLQIDTHSADCYIGFKLVFGSSGKIQMFWYPFMEVFFFIILFFARPKKMIAVKKE